MLILHLSDLHFGTHSRFTGEDLAKLGKAFFKDLNAARGSFAMGSRIDLVAVTGDIAESGKPTEFKDGERFLAALAGALGLDRRRFVFVPGNHDVSWPACKKVEADQEEASRYAKLPSRSWELGAVPGPECAEHWWDARRAVPAGRLVRSIGGSKATHGRVRLCLILAVGARRSDA